MAKRLQDYVKYTTEELNGYSQTEGSCVNKVNTNLHLSMGPFCLTDFKRNLKEHILRSKLGFYDVHLDGIVLDVRNIKVLGTTGAMRADDPIIHVNINADVYIFKPEEEAVLKGIVKHIGPHQVGVILYRVFNANLRVVQKVDKSEVQMDQEVEFRIEKFNLQNIYPYIEGELLTPGHKEKVNKRSNLVFKQEDSSDSGIEAKDGVQELDGLLSIIKTEAPLEFAEALEESINKKSKQKKRKTLTEDSSSENPSNSKNKKLSKKLKNSVSRSSSNIEDTEILDSHSSKNVKQETILSSDESLSPVTKKIKIENGTIPAKKSKSKTSMLENIVKVKEEIDW